MSTAGDGPRWIRHRPDAAQRRTTLALAVGVGVAVGATVLYLSRLFVARERLTPLEPTAPAPRDARLPAGRREGPGA